MKPAIRVENLSKQYRIGTAKRGAKRNLTESIADGASAMWRTLSGRARGTDAADEFWALKDISFEVQPGEVVGIIGRNGAGKSSLLKILSQIVEPTAGRAVVRGRMGSLLEVGTGFHPELSGRENIYLNGSILGMRRKEIDRKFNEIVAFSEIDRFLDTPVKRYSSGMYVRLAFSVAAFLRPEVLIVDEVLAVGDAAFQKRCLGKMQDVAHQGRTVLFVSHNLPAVRSFCTRGILLDGGRLLGDGNVSSIVSRFLQMMFDGNSAGTSERKWDPADAPGNDRIRLTRVAILPDQSEPGRQIRVGDGLRLEVDFVNLTPGASILLNLSLYAADGSEVFESVSTTDAEWFQRPMPAAPFRSVCRIPPHLLNEGQYRIRIIFCDSEVTKIYDHRDVLSFYVADLVKREIPWYGRFMGHVHPRLAWATERLDNEGPEFSAG